MEKEGYGKILILLIGILIGLIVTMVFMSNWFYQIPYSVQFKINGYTKENALAVCSGKDLEKTALCLNSFVRGIFKYKETKDSLNIDFETLKEVGGDCYNYYLLYKELAQKLGFETEKVEVDVNADGHIWIVVYDETGRCSLDQKHIDCFMYG